MYYIFNTDFENLPLFMEYIYQFFICVIYGLGITWTFEIFNVNINPLVVSHFSALLPVLNTSSDAIITIAATSLLFTGVVHYTWWRIGDLYHLVDKVACYLYILVTLRLDIVYLTCLFGVWICHVNGNKHPDRSWKSIEHHTPHMLMHFLSGMGVYNIVV